MITPGKWEYDDIFGAVRAYDEHGFYTVARTVEEHNGPALALVPDMIEALVELADEVAGLEAFLDETRGTGDGKPGAPLQRGRALLAKLKEAGAL